MDGNESTGGDGNGDKDGNGDGNEDETVEDGGEAKKRNRTRVVDAIWHFHSSRVILSADRGWCLRAPDSSVRTARCLYTRIAPRGSPGPRDGNERTGSGAGSESGAGTETGTGSRAGTRR